MNNENLQSDLKEISHILLEGARPGSDAFLRTLPFSLDDATAGAENEFQSGVAGGKGSVDLPLSIRSSNYFKNVLRRTVSGDAPQKAITSLERFVEDNENTYWDNSWVRFPRRRMGGYAGAVLEHDLQADKRDPNAGSRDDVDRFIRHGDDEETVRIPISYLLKLSLAEAIGKNGIPHIVKETGKQLLSHFLNDNTSPEIFSFHPVPLNHATGMGRALARETLKRFLLCQFLLQFANERFGIMENGQRAEIYFAPHPPMRQKALNDIVSDSFYRELFMSPCLSGWDRGADKNRYMILCHQVLSRSQLNSVAKLKEAGIITRNLVVIPNLSNICLANNGTHVSLGSLRLGRALESASGFTPDKEKYLGDLSIKIVEHFLPLFVGTYSGAPYRLDFWDFHPEKVLGFLPHELDFTHLRMLWRRWKKKADCKLMGQPFTPFGPLWFDRLISRIFRLRGDFVCDFRLIDYLVSLLSTDQSPAFDGSPDSEKRLRKDLVDLGVFDDDMSLYLLLKLRRYEEKGFSGMESRYYSLFENLLDDMGEAVNIQWLLAALSYKYILSGQITHDHIPDTPFVESERRQAFFGAAIGIPTFFVRKDTKNLFMLKILKKAKRIRSSHRYPGYLRVYNVEYRKALLEILREDAPDLIELFSFRNTMADLKGRIESPKTHSAAERLTRGILRQSGVSKPRKLSGDEFNRNAESYYRKVLKKRHMEQALVELERDLLRIERKAVNGDDRLKQALGSITRTQKPSDLLFALRADLLNESVPPDAMQKLIHLMLITIHDDMMQAKRAVRRTMFKEKHVATAPIH